MKKFFVDERGINEATLKKFGISFPQKGTAVFPYYADDGTTVVAEKRRVENGGKRQFFWPVGQELILYGLWTMDTPQFIVEGETDTMRLWQELHANGVRGGVCGLPGIESWKDEWAEHFNGVSEVYVVLDNDQDYLVQARVDKCWQRIRSVLGPKAKRIRLPGNCKDLCDFFSRYSYKSFDKLIGKAQKGLAHFTPLDLSAAPAPYDWLVEDYICQGDITLMLGEPSIGKTFLAMDLAVAVAEPNRMSWLGQSVLRHGRVLYFDEENPEDVVRHRLKALGLEHPDNLRYIHHQGVRVDKMPDLVMDEAWAFNPTLIIFDSLTRFHTGDENNAGFINELFGGCFKPLARDTGATVLILHHTNKSDFSSSFVRSRGSSDITASIDSGFDVAESGGGRLSVTRYKSRRGSAGGTTFVSIVDRPHEKVEIETFNYTI